VFRALSSNPSAKLLLVFLEQGPHTTSLPGLFSAGPGALAESLGWTKEQFLEAFEELHVAGFARADWSAPLVYLPDSLRDFNAPDNLNVFKSWCSTFEELPDCDLKENAADIIADFLDEMARSAHRNADDDDGRKRADTRKAMARMWRDRMGNGTGNPRPTQKQYQEQKQETGAGKGESREGNLVGRDIEPSSRRLSHSASAQGLDFTDFDEPSPSKGDIPSMKSPTAMPPREKCPECGSSGSLHYKSCSRNPIYSKKHTAA
jgi:hypothetical protein